MFNIIPRTFQPSSGGVTHLNNANHRILALGNQDSWMSVESGTGTAQWSNNINVQYPKLPSQYNTSSLGGVRQIVLGYNGNYFIRGNTRNIWCLDQSIINLANLNQNSSSMEVVALGMSGAYIIQLSDGRIFYDLKGHYKSLRTGFEQAVAVEGKRLSVSNATAPSIFEHD
jgi:hypothetical protein